MHRRTTPYQKALNYLYGLQRFGIKFGLSKTENLLAASGNPHLGRKYVHIAGTNGKGSVATLLAAILRAAGYRVGLYTSPHLVRFTERFKINDAEIPRERVSALVESLRKAVTSPEPPTYFEFTTAMALLYFAEEEADLSIMEVGMGGRLDATNVIRPLVSVITNIGLEHRQYLGKRLLDIAREKAGIVKPGVTLITAVSQPEVIALLRAVCKERDATMKRVGADVRYRTTAAGLNYWGSRRQLAGLQLGLLGEHQSRNASLALAVIEELEGQGINVSEGDIRTGLKQAVWPGRLQVVARAPTVVLDGAHNPPATRNLALAVRKAFSYRKLILVIGVMQDKEIGPLLAGIVPAADRVIYTRPEYYRAAAPEVLQAAAPAGRKGEVVPKLTAALDKARAVAGAEDLILVCGSLFTVGEALTYFDPQRYRPDGG